MMLSEIPKVLLSVLLPNPPDLGFRIVIENGYPSGHEVHARLNGWWAIAERLEETQFPIVPLSVV
jgi:hypothetical protein